jgi:Flavin-binding monooxygenase-like
VCCECRYTVLTAAHGAISCQYIVNATGKSAVPSIPRDLPSELLQLVSTHAATTHSTPTAGTAASTMTVLHSSQVRDLSSIAHKRVCIVGCGNSGADIAAEIIRLRQQEASAAQHSSSTHYNSGSSSCSSSNGSSTTAACEPVHMSIRHVPPVIMRQWGCLSGEWISKHCTSYMPAAVADAMLEAFAAARWGYRWRQRVFPSALLGSSSSAWKAISSGRVPLIDKGSGSFVESVMVSGHTFTCADTTTCTRGHAHSKTCTLQAHTVRCIAMLYYLAVATVSMQRCDESHAR